MSGQSRDYQTISGYNGTLYGEPKYEGIEYDWEVPENQVVASPGGVSAVHHHWTHGFNGRGNTSSDIYAGQGPRYISGVYGNMYQIGQEAGQNMGYYPAAPDVQYWQNQEPQQYSYSDSQSSMWAPDMEIYGDPGSYQTTPYGVTPIHPEPVGGPYSEKKSIEGYSADDDSDFEWIESSDKNSPTDGATEINDQGTTIIFPTTKPWVLFLFFILAFIAFDLWGQTTNLFIKQYFHGGTDPPWKRALLYAIVFTTIFTVIIYFSGVPLTKFE